jgi:predicted secreted hydrolase
MSHGRSRLVPFLLTLVLTGAAAHAARGEGAVAAAAWARMLEDLPAEGFRAPEGPWRLRLPVDHGAHPQTRTEAWTVSANLRDDAGEAVALQLALLRVALVPPEAPRRVSAWAAREVYRGHLTVVRAGGTVVGEERFARAAAGLAGHDPARRRVWLENWSIHYGGGRRGQQLALRARLGETAFDLALTPAKAPVPSGRGGTGVPWRGFAITRLAVQGTLRTAQGARAVSGVAWLDRLWGEVPLPLGAVVWDRLQLQLGDGSELALLRLRRRDGQGVPRVTGFRVGPSGTVARLDGAAVTFRPVGGAGAGRYPLEWLVAANGLDMRVVPWVDGQSFDFSVPLWSGAVSATGRSPRGAVTASGYLQLMGYVGR